VATLQKVESATYSAEQVRELLREAVAICDEADLSHAERIAWLPSILELLGQKAVTFVAEQPIPGFGSILNGRR
jgi:hypothetical protein